MERSYFPVAKRGLCCGCGGCVSLFPQNPTEMVYSREGYLRPTAEKPLSRAERRRLNAMCPGANLVRGPAETNVADDPVWGPMIDLCTGHSTDDAIRRHASSGGALSAVLLYLVGTGEVDFVLHTRVSDEHPLKNVTVCSRTREEILAGAGSRYAPSSPLAGIESHLDGEEMFAFVGKPCDVAGLRQLARTDPRINERIPYALAFMCGGVPSERGTEAVITELGLGGKEIEAFRYRGDGWPGETVAVTKDGVRASMDYDSSWGTILNRHLQWRCKICPDGIGEFADITFADGWFLSDQGRPDFSEREGRSIILTRTRAGAALFKRVVEAGDMVSEPQERGYLDAAQPFQKRRKSQIIMRLMAMLATGRMPPRYRGLHLWAAMRRASLPELAKGFAATLVRLLQKKPS